MTQQPTTELQSRFSSLGVEPTPWTVAEGVLTTAEVYWISTVRPNGSPHVTPLIGIWTEGRFHFCTGAAERKGRNLAANPKCVVTTGSNGIGEGLDIVVEGRAVRMRDDAHLQRRTPTPRNMKAGISTSRTKHFKARVAKHSCSRWIQ